MMQGPQLNEEADQSPNVLSLERWGQAQFRRLLEKLPAGAYTCDPQGLITYFNQRAVEIWGRAPKLNDPEDRFCGSFKLFSSDGAPLRHDECWMALALQNNREYNGHEIVIERPDGRRITALAHANPIHDDRGKLLGAVNVLLDISDRKQAEDVLREAGHSKDEFLATLAHELRNPLAPIRNAVQILGRQGSASTESDWALEVIERQTRQMTRLIDDLLDVSRITRNRLDLRKEPVDLAKAMQAAVETSRALLEAGGHELTVRMPSLPIVLEADFTRLAQAFSNLLNNAARYTERGGHVWFTAERQGSDAVVRVRDTGIGIPADMLSRIFDAFTQVDRSLERSQGGLGIGLMLVKRLVEMHGGTIQAHSAGPGEGTELTIRLPAVLARLSEAPAVGCGNAGPAIASALRILIVDDNRDSAATLAILLRSTGSDIRTAHDGLEAVGVASEFRPDVVVLDIGLPKMNGYEAARAIRQQSWGMSVVLIAMTGWGQEGDKQQSKEAGFDHHMVKPVDPAALMEMLASLEQAVVPR